MMAFGRSWALWKYLGIGDIFGLGDGGYMFQLSWKIRISKHQPHAKAVPQCPSGGLELNIQLQQWQLHHLDQTWAQTLDVSSKTPKNVVQRLAAAVS